ncbi:MAG TPA: hypothetical protein VFA15_05530, partial [Nitrososphaera sp.]|nr:hypothetical protein [Nitrososphaera sp.]
MSYATYASAVIKNKSNVPPPERVSWLIWTLTSLLILMTYWQLGARTTIWVPLAYVIGSASLTIIAFIKSK